MALISGIQRGEFNLPITPADQPDLMDIPGFYLNGSLGPGGFWVALDPAGAPVGSIALLNIGGGQGALRKMFVAQEQRGSGLAAALLKTLLCWCVQPEASGMAGGSAKPGHGQPIRELFLGTTARFLAAHRFYEKQGFRRVSQDALPPAFPVMAVDTVFYALSLPKD